MDNLQRDKNQDMKRELEELEEKVVCRSSAQIRAKGLQEFL